MEHVYGGEPCCEERRVEPSHQEGFLRARCSLEGCVAPSSGHCYRLQPQVVMVSFCLCPVWLLLPFSSLWVQISVFIKKKKKVLHLHCLGIKCKRKFDSYWHTFSHNTGEGNGNPLHYSCLENPMDRGAWWATVHEVAKSQTWLKRLSTHTHVHNTWKQRFTHQERKKVYNEISTSFPHSAEHC